MPFTSLRVPITKRVVRVIPIPRLDKKGHPITEHAMVLNDKLVLVQSGSAPEDWYPVEPLDELLPMDANTGNIRCGCIAGVTGKPCKHLSVATDAILVAQFDTEGSLS